jgi:hypothetical protein
MRFAVTVLHDLVTIALVFMVPAMLAALRLAATEGRRALFWSGLACFGLLLAGVMMYYGSVLRSLLPVTQKAIFVTSAAWLLTLQRASVLIVCLGLVFQHQGSLRSCVTYCRSVPSCCP